MKFITTLFFLAVTSIMLLAQNSTEPIEIRINELRNNDGQIVVLLYKKGQKFSSRSKPFKTIVFKKIINNKCTFNITKLNKGEYAYIVYHDEDSNFKIRTNFIGIPREGVGSSNNDSGIPNYSSSKFYFNGKKQQHIIIINYL